MSRLYFFIDGLNLYHALDHVEAVPDPKRLHRFKWASLTKLCDCYRLSQSLDILALNSLSPSRKVASLHRWHGWGLIL